MNGLLSHVVGAVLGAMRPRQVLPTLPMLALAGLLAVMSVVFFAVAGFYALAPSIGPAAAAAVVAVILLLLAILLALGALLTHRKPQFDPALLNAIVAQLEESGLPIWAVVGLAGVALGFLRPQGKRGK